MTLSRKTTNIPHGQQWLIKRMEQLGYKPNPTGVCFAVANMGRQAILTNQLDLYDERFEKINAIPLESFARQVEELRNKDAASQQFRNEIYALFDGINIYHSPHLYPELFEPNSNIEQDNRQITDTYLDSIALEEKGGAENIATFYGIYTPAELKIYFEKLKTIIRQMQPPSASPITLILSSSIHAIRVGYNPSTDAWSLIDLSRGRY